MGLPPSAGRDRGLSQADGRRKPIEKVVDRLLDCPTTANGWARHWLDLVAFPETYGHEFDYEIPNAYRYRDYLIRASTPICPTTDLSIEQVAGDLSRAAARHPTEG